MTTFEPSILSSDGSEHGTRGVWSPASDRLSCFRLSSNPRNSKVDGRQYRAFQLISYLMQHPSVVELLPQTPIELRLQPWEKKYKANTFEVPGSPYRI